MLIDFIINYDSFSGSSNFSSLEQIPKKELIVFRIFFHTIVIYFLIFTATAHYSNILIPSFFMSKGLTALLLLGIPSIFINSLVLAFALRFLKQKSLIFVIPVKVALFFLATFIGVCFYALISPPWFAVIVPPLMPPHMAAALSFLCFQDIEPTKRKVVLNGLIALAAVLFFGIFSYPTFKKINILAFGGGSVPFVTSVQIKKKMSIMEVLQYYCPEKYPNIEEIENADGTPEFFSREICRPDNLKFLLDFYKETKLLFDLERMQSQVLAPNFMKTRSSIIMLYGDEYEFPKEDFSLPVPQSGSVIFYNQGGTWKSFPRNPQFTEREIKISKDYQKKNGKKMPMLCVSISDYFGSGYVGDCMDLLSEIAKFDQGDE